MCGGEKYDGEDIIYDRREHIIEIEFRWVADVNEC